MVMLCRAQCQHMRPLLDEALVLLVSSDWSCHIRHVYRKANRCADILAGMGHTSSFECLTLDAAPGSLSIALDADFRGVRLPRLVN